MKMQNRFKTIGMTVAIGLFAFACGPETQKETNEEVDEAQVEVNETNTEVNTEANASLDDFNTWVATSATRAETVTAEEYREMRAEYNRREAELEAESATWDDETRREWEEAKNEWKEFENNVQKRLGDIDDIDVDVNVKRDNN